MRIQRKYAMMENRTATRNGNQPRRVNASFAAEVEAAFREFVLRPEFPCVGAKAALNSDSYTLHVYDELGSDEAASALSTALRDFTQSTLHIDPHPNLLPHGEGTDLPAADHSNSAVEEIPLPYGEGTGLPAAQLSTGALEEVRLPNGEGTGLPAAQLSTRTLEEVPLPYGEGTGLPAAQLRTRAVEEVPLPMGGGRVRVPSSEYATFVAIFERPRKTTEIEFENLFWKQLRALHDYDAQRFAWDSHVSSDPADPHFSFSFGGQALYVIGLHANSSREARRFPWPALVFNPHEQFERLRADGKWKRMQETIRSRDLQLQGSINPMLSDFGEQSEARQYSGRAVEDNWRPPFPTGAGKCPFAH
jgi:FPC/CPF motif-containing protein YcgG